MRKIYKVLAMFLALVMVISTLPVQAEAATKIKINKTQTIVYVGSSTTLKISGTNSKVKWSTSKKSVATVSSKGKVTAKKAGIAIITAKVFGKRYTCKVTVKNPYLNSTKQAVYVGSTYTLKITGTTAKSWTSSNKSVATVSSKGKVTAKKAGTTTITCKGKDGKSYKCTVTVKKPSINTTKKTLEVRKTYTLKLTGTSIKSVSSSNKNVATVSSKGKVTAKKAGTATITLKGADGKSYKCTVTVKSNGSSDEEEHTHTYTSTITAPTCTKQGYTTYKCKDCGDAYVDNYTDALGHDYKGTVTKAATCTAEGVMTYKCSRCGDTYTESIAKISHSWMEIGRQEPLCNLEGSIEYKCSYCGETKTEKNGAKLGHNLDELEKVVTEASCEIDGKIGYWCPVCSAIVEERTIAATGHKYVLNNGDEGCEYICENCSQGIRINELEDQNVYFGEDGYEVVQGNMVYLVSLASQDTNWEKVEYVIENEDIVSAEQDNYSDGSISTRYLQANKPGETNVIVKYDGNKVFECKVKVGYLFVDLVKEYVNGNEEVLEFVGYKRDSIYDQYLTMVETVGNAVKENITENMTDYEKVSVLLRWYEENISYDDINYGQGINSIFYYKNGACNAYAESFSFFMNVLDIPCYYISGEVYGRFHYYAYEHKDDLSDLAPLYDVGHAWNVVYLDSGNGKGEQWYYVDTTWSTYNFDVTIAEWNDSSGIAKWDDGAINYKDVNIFGGAADVTSVHIAKRSKRLTQYNYMDGVGVMENDFELFSPHMPMEDIHNYSVNKDENHIDVYCNNCGKLFTLYYRVGTEIYTGNTNLSMGELLYFDVFDITDMVDVYDISKFTIMIEDENILKVSFDETFKKYMLSAEGEGTTKVSVSYDGAIIDEFNVTVGTAYTMPEAIRQYQAGNESAIKDYNSNNQETIQNIASILNDITETSMSNYQKVVSVLDWCKENISSTGNGLIIDNYSLYYMFDPSRRWADEYSQAVGFSLLMDALDIPCYTICGEGYYEEADYRVEHAWNAVYIDCGEGENWYYVSDWVLDEKSIEEENELYGIGMISYVDKDTSIVTPEGTFSNTTVIRSTISSKKLTQQDYLAIVTSMTSENRDFKLVTP